MADNDQFNDEYQFSELEPGSPEGTDDLDETFTEPVKESQEKRALYSTNHVKRNAIIAVAVIILMVVIYQFFAGGTSEIQPNKEPVPKALPVVPPPKPIETKVEEPIPVPVQPAQPDPMVSQKLSALEISQENMRSQVTSVGNQLSGINSNVNALSAQIAQLNQTIAALSQRLESQSQVIEILTRPKRVPRKPVSRMHRMPANVYYIKAIIPGRAWLIARNGTTLTVREGTEVAGYGIIKLIDPNQGRVLTSSGKVIKFSQEDS